MTGVILAGGASSRMGTNKAFITVSGQPIIDSILCVFKKIFSEIIIVSNTPEDFDYCGVTVVSDIMPQKGALGGIYTGLIYSSCDRCFIIACDMPYAAERLLRHIISLPGDAVVPVTADRYEPLFAVYSKKCANIICNQILTGNLKITDFYNKIELRKVGEDEMRLYDSDLRSLVNLNTPDDIKNVLP